MKCSPEKKPRNSIRPNQIWKLGDHRLLVGSSLDPKLVEKLIGKDRINAVISDPPYGISYTESKEGFSTVKVNRKIANDDIATEAGYMAFTKTWLAPLLPRLARKNSIYVFNCDKMIFALKKATDDLGVKFSQLIVWVKNHAVIGRKDYLPQHELILFGWYGTHAFRRSKDKSVVFYPKPSSSPFHPTTKPLGLIRRLVLNSTAIGDVVFDGFGGSGTTALACEQTGRRCLMAELDLDYCTTIIDRWQRLTGKKAQLIT